LQPIDLKVMGIPEWSVFHVCFFEIATFSAPC